MSVDQNSHLPTSCDCKRTTLFNLNAQREKSQRAIARWDFSRFTFLPTRPVGLFCTHLQISRSRNLVSTNWDMKRLFLISICKYLIGLRSPTQFFAGKCLKKLRRVKAHSLRYKYNIICLCGISWSFNEEKKFIFMKFRSVLNLPSLFLRSNNFVFVLGDSRSCFPTRHLCFITSWGCATLIVQYR